LLKDGIIEISHATYVNPISVVQREGKTPTICLDARRINQVTFQDRRKAPPIQELLERFHGAQYMTALDLSSAFLQIPLRDTSRACTAFGFENQIYQYTRTPTASKIR
jgi:hypothetical protein